MPNKYGGCSLNSQNPWPPAGWPGTGSAPAALRKDAIQRCENAAAEDPDVCHAIAAAAAALPPTSRGEPDASGAKARETASGGIAQPLWETITRAGGSLGLIEDALRRKPALVRAYLNALTREHGEWPEWLNMARWQTGSLMLLPPGVALPYVVEAPLAGRATSTRDPVSRHLVIVEHGAKLAYIDGCAAPGASSDERFRLRLVTSEIFVGEQAALDYTSFAHFGGTVHDLSRKFVHVAAKGQLTLTEIIVDPGDTIRPPIIELAHDASLVYRQLVVLTRGQTNVPLGAHITGPTDPAQPPARATVSARLIAAGGSSVICDRLQPPGGSGILWQADLKALCWDDASSLLLAGKPWDEASSPGFALTMSDNPALQLAYLRTRGFALGEARAMIGEALAADLLDDLPLEYAVEVRRFLWSEEHARA